MATAGVRGGGENPPIRPTRRPGARYRRMTMSRPQLLVLSWRDRSHPEGGGAELFAEEVCSRLSRRGWDVTFFTAAYPGALAEESRDGVRFVRAGGRNSVYLRGALAYLRGGLGRPDVIVDVHNGVPFFARLWARRPVVVLVHHLHREQWRMLFGPITGRIGWLIESAVSTRVHRANRYLTVSEASRRALAGIGVTPDRVTVVHNGVTAPPMPEAGKADRPTIVSLGRLVPHKQVEHLIDALATLRSRIPELHLEIVGEGYWEPRLREHASRAGVDGSVTFHGRVDEATKFDLLSRAWVLGLPSVREGWGLVVMEAAAMGTPAVAYSSAGGPSGSIVDGHTGFLVEEPDDMARSLGTVLTDPDLRDRLGRNARARAAEFDWEATVDGVEALIRDTANRRETDEALAQRSP